MKILNTVIVTSVLALGLAGNSMAAPNQIELKVMQQKSAQAQRQAAQQKVVQARQQAIKAQQQAAKQKAAQAKKQAAKKKVVIVKVQSKPVVNSNYRVAAGDTLYRIAQRNNVSVEKLVKLNSLWGNKATNLRVGTVIRLR